MEIKRTWKLLMFLFAMLAGPAAMAQHNDHADRHEKIEAARIAHITSELSLSPEQARKFWPVYNELTQKREAIRHEQRRVMHAVRENTPKQEEARNAISTHLRLEKEEAVLEEEYYGSRLQAVLEPTQILQLMKAEHEFKKMLLKRLKDRRPN